MKQYISDNVCTRSKRNINRHIITHKNLKSVRLDSRIMKRKAKEIELFIDGNPPARFPSGIIVGDALEHSGNQHPYPVVAAYLDNKIVELNRHITYGGQLNAIHLGTVDGMRLYQRSLSFVLVRAVKEVYPDLQVYINHPISKGIYCELHASSYTNIKTFHLTKKDVEIIKQRMREIIEADEPFIRREVPLSEAIRIFKRRGQQDKAKLLQYRQKNNEDGETVSIYHCGTERNHFYGYLVPSTGYLKVFDLKFHSPGFILRYPTLENPNVLPPFVEQEKMFQVFQEYEAWAKILGLETVGLLNDLIVAGGVEEFIKVAEALQEKKIVYISDMITHHHNQPRVILIGGPSASGKTTFSKRLCIQLRVNGSRPVVISSDDFFVDREHTPRRENGEMDFESFEAIDFRLLNRVISDLLKGKTVQMPCFNFPAGRRMPGSRIRLEKDQIIILEGIHALNDRLLSTIPCGLKFRIYVSALTTLSIDNHNRILTSDSRLIRRVVRDSQFRNYSASETIARWPSVRRGEEINIFPYQENADVMFNSALMYEIGALKKYAEPHLRKVPRSDPIYSEACRLLKFLSYFLDVPDDKVPHDSILREFIGGSSFTY